MAIKKKTAASKIEIDLTGPQGNAFCLLGTAKDLCEMTGQDYKTLATKMKSGDYENLVQVFDDAFGDFVTLWR